MTGTVAEKVLNPEGRIVYDYIKSVVKDVIDVALVTEKTVFNTKECEEIKKKLLKGPLNCSFVDDDCKVMSVADFLSIVRFQMPIPKDLSQYR